MYLAKVISWTFQQILNHYLRRGLVITTFIITVMFWTESGQSSALSVVVSFLEVLDSQEREKSKLGGGLGGGRGKTSLWENKG